MRQPKRLAHRQAEQTRARAQVRWVWEDAVDDLEDLFERTQHGASTEAETPHTLEEEGHQRA